MIVNMAQIDYITITNNNGIRFVCEEYIPDLGYYSTQEKAMKVLDMIQNEFVYAYQPFFNVFQMPQDSEVE